MRWARFAGASSLWVQSNFPRPMNGRQLAGNHEQGCNNGCSRKRTDELNDDDPHTEPAMSADSLNGSPSKHFLYHPAIKHFSDRPER